MTQTSDNIDDQFVHKVKPIEKPIIYFGFNVVDIIAGGFLFIVVAQLLGAAMPEFPGSSVISFVIGLAAGYGYMNVGQYLREYAPPALVPYFMYWLRSGDHYVVTNDTYPMPLVPTRTTRATSAARTTDAD